MKRMLLIACLACSLGQAQEWTPLALSTEGLTAFAIAPSDPRTIYAGSIGRLFESSNAGASWDTVLRAGAVTALAVDPRDPDVLYVAGGLNHQGQVSLVLKTSDGGQTWTKADLGISYGTLCEIAIDPLHPDTVYASSADQTAIPGFYRTTNAGVSWTRILDSGVQTFTLNSCNPSEIYALAGEQTIRTTDAGMTWQTLSPVPSLAGTSLSFARGGSCVLAGSRWYRTSFRIGEAVYASTDSGVTWQPRVSGLPDSVSVKDIAVVAGPLTERVFIAAGRVYEAGGDLIWKDISGEGIRRITKLEIGGDLLYAMECGGGLYARSAITSVGGNRQEPGAMSLGQNFPNPFNPTTTIEYRVAEVGGRGSGVCRVKLAVYDVLGREVAVLVEEQQSPGRYSVRFDVAGLPSGVYFYRLQAGDYVEAKNLVVVR